MVVINKNSNNELILTLTENATLTSPYYLFEFTSEMSRDRVVFLAEDLSDNPSRYNEFLITETSGTTDFTSGTITLSPRGQWSYRIFEQESSSNLDVTQVDNPTPLELGVVKVKGDDLEIEQYISNTDTDNTFIINGE